MNELNSPRLRWLVEDDLHNRMLDLWTEVKLLTGAILHTGEMLLMQVEILKVFLMTNERFAGLTVNEIRHAFYLNNQGEYEEVYKHWNKELNAEFVGNVLLGYLKYKRGVYQRKGEEIKKIVHDSGEQRAGSTTVVTDKVLQEIIQWHYESWKQGNVDLVFVSAGVYNYLRRIGAAEIYSRKYWHRMIQMAMWEREEYGKSGLLFKDSWEKNNILRVRKIYEVYREHGWIPRSEYAMVVHTLRRRSYLKFLSWMGYLGVKDIFKEIPVEVWK